MINQLRQNPKLLITSLNNMLKNFEGDLYKRGGDKPNIRTKEGAKAVEEAIAYL